MDLSSEAADAAKALIDETARLEVAQEALAAARNAETDARNRVNQAQKRFDHLVSELRKAAVPGTDWYSERAVRNAR